MLSPLVVSAPVCCVGYVDEGVAFVAGAEILTGIVSFPVNTG